MGHSNHDQFKISPDSAIIAGASDCYPYRKTDNTTAILRLALEGAAAGVWQRDLVTETVRLCPLARRMLGLPDSHSGVLEKDEWQKLADSVDVEQIQQWATSPNALIAPHVQEFRSQRADGESRWVRVFARMLPDHEGRLTRLVGLMYDDTDRKRAEDAIRESEERLRLIQDAALIGTFVIGADRKTVGSRQFYRNLGMPTDTAFLDRHMQMERIHPDDRERVEREAAIAVQSADGQDIEYRINRADTGEIRWIFSRTKYERGDDGQLIRIVGVHLDITEPKRAEEAMRDSEERLHLVQGAALIGTFVTDPDRRTTGSKQFFRNLGLPEDTEFLNREAYMELVHPDDRERLDSEASAASLSADGIDIEYRFNRADTGELRWIFVRMKYERTDDGQLLRMVGAHLDITDRKRAEETMRESEERLHLVQDAALIGTFVIGADGRTVGSKQFYRNLGMPADTAFLDRHMQMQCIHPDDRERVERESAIAVQSADGHDIEYRISRADTGELRWIFSRIKFERADDGQLIRIIGAHLDITEPKRAEEALHESVALNQSIIESSADCVKLIDLDGRLLFMNKPGLAALEVKDASELWEKNWAELWPRQERANVHAAIQTAREGQTGRFNGGCPTATGKPKWWDVVVTPICDERGQPRQLLAISRDVTESRNQMAQIRWTASHDMLTELPNRRYFRDRLERVLARAATRGVNVGLLQLDVDDFKQTNDALGHHAGDVLLKSFAQRLQSSTAGNETVARLGGDEFAIIVPDLTAGRRLSDVVEDIQAHLAEPFIFEGRVFDCRASIGQAIYPQHGETVEDLLKSSDIALYAAKSSGRGKVRTFHPAMRIEMHKRLNMVGRARTALKGDLIFPYYQPKVHFATGVPAGFEALLRWQDSLGEIQLPAAIAAAFEDLDVAQALSERMQLRVLADVRRWLDHGVDFGHVAINASAAEFRQNDFAERLLDRVKAAGVPTSSIELEVTETVFLGRGAEYVDRALHLLSAEGMRIALDDFGTGYASLSHLKQFPVDIIKIDQSFVRNINVDPDDSAIIKALISLGKSLGIGIVAEGIENHAQFDFLAEQGCDYGQGFLFSKAVASAEVPMLLSKLNNKGVTW